ncbi:MAG TPA: SCO family protein [Casimicrobiaceae bacterium]|nr:SCO family protein [Casimicrobiaceae bacterium]
MSRRACLALAAALALLVVACGPRGPSFQGSDVSGSSFGHDFTLTDAAGRTRSMADYRGKAVALFFGYTQCPDVCPTTLAALAGAMKLLGPDADRVQVLFVTVDPERDTPELLAKYVPAFDPRFVGLRGDAAATERTAREFKVIYQKVPGSAPDRYTMDHSAGTYLFDPQGRLRVYEGNAASPEVFAHDLRALLAEAGS